MSETRQRGIKTSLDRILEPRNLPAKPVRLAILRQLAKAIDEAFGNGSLTGDLTPGNVSVSTSLNGPEIAVTLLGAGGLFVPEEELTTDGTIPEAARYLPPERILGTGTDVRSYEFSLGVIAYELVCGRRPFDAANLTQFFYRVCSEKPVAAEEVDRALTSRVGAAINRALGKDPEQRFSSCTTFADELTTALLECPGWADAGYEGKPPQVSNAPAWVAFGASSTRIRRRYGDQPDDEVSEGKGAGSRRRYGLIAALCLAAIGLVVFVWRYKPHPNLPVQVLDTNAGPATPPPESSHAPAPLTSAPVKQPPPSLSKPDRAKRETPAPTTAAVGILTDPPSADIVVDGDLARSCTTPCTLSLPPGRHTLSASVDGFSRAQRIFSLPQDKSLFIAFTRQLGTLLVTSTPSGLAILIDGKNYGQTPATLHLAPGEHRLLVKNGTAQHGETIYVQADAIQAKAINW